jgi:hypothetical protein
MSRKILQAPTKALTILEPFAWAICAQHKTIENRTWSTAHRGPIAIHSSSAKRYPEGFEDFILAHSPAMHAEYDDERITDDNQILHFGYILGVADLVGIVQWKAAKGGPTFNEACDAAGFRDWRLQQRELEPKLWADGRSGFCWLIGEVVQFAQPIAAKGALNLWNMPADLAAKVAAALADGPHGSPVAFRHKIAAARKAAAGKLAAAK